MNNIIQKITEKFENKGNKKTLENLIVFVIILVATIIFINYIWNDNKDEVNNSNNLENFDTSINVMETSTETINEESLAYQLENILRKLEGVGNVSVLITYNESKQIVPIYNEDMQESVTQEEDNQGGVRTINETSSKKEVVYEETNGQKSIITSKVVIPEIKGAVIIAQGAGNVNVKNNIIQATEAATGLPTHKIQVFEMK